MANSDLNNNNNICQKSIENRLLENESRIKILERNVSELQEQLTKAYIRIKQLIADNDTSNKG